MHGDSVPYPTAQITLKVDSWTKNLLAAVVPKLPVDVMISWMDYTSDETSGVTSLAVLTRSQRRKQMVHIRGCEGGDDGVAD